MATKPKTLDRANLAEINGKDLFETPDYATRIILGYIPVSPLGNKPVIWEPCCGSGRMVRYLKSQGHNVTGTDILLGQEYDIQNYVPEFYWDVAITNPPFSGKRQVHEILRKFGKPYALLIPAEWAIWVWEAVFDDGYKLAVPKRRIDYITPTGRMGSNSSAKFHSMWLMSPEFLGPQLSGYNLITEEKRL